MIEGSFSNPFKFTKITQFLLLIIQTEITCLLLGSLTDSVGNKLMSRMALLTNCRLHKIWLSTLPPSICRKKVKQKKKIKNKKIPNNLFCSY